MRDTRPQRNGTELRNTMLSSRDIWFTIHTTSGLGPAAAQKLAIALTTNGMSVDDLGGMDGEQLALATGLSESLSFALAHEISNSAPLADDEQLVVPGDDNYPNTRFLTANPPLPVALWSYGRRSLLDDGTPALAVAGSRNTSEELLELAHKIGSMAAQHGWTIVSGLAAGVDSASHQGTLDRGGSTIGVLASGTAAKGRHWQPESFDDVCVVSQFAPQEPWSGPRAMQRNSTIAALSDNVVIVAAGDSGGSWEMGQLCLKRNKPLFVIDIEHEAAPGNQRLISAGATPVHIDALEVLFTQANTPPEPPTQPSLF